jgi:chromosome partitioning protein
MDPKITAKEAANFLGITTQGLHKRLKKLNIDCKKGKNKTYLSHNEARELFNLKFKKTIISIQIVKGGAGKTAITSALAVRANLYGARVLCIDLDQQANLSRSFGVRADRKTPVMIDVIEGRADFEEGIVEITDGLHLFPSHIRNAVIDNTIIVERMSIDRVYKNLIDPLFSYYDLVFIDCPPALTHSVAAATLASDLVIAPVTPEVGALDGLHLTVEEFGKLEKHYRNKISIRIIQNRFDARTTLSHSILKSLIKDPKFNGKIFRSYIRSTQEFPNCYSKAVSIYDSLKVSPAKEDIDLLTRELLETVSPKVNSKKEDVSQKIEEEALL